MSSKDEDKQPTVPKFSSFKAASAPKELKAPKFSSFKPKETGTSKSKDASSDEARHRDRDSRKRSRHSDDHRHEHRSKHSRRDPRHRHRDSSKPQSRAGTPNQPRPDPKILRHGTGVSGLYVVDTKGDPLITRYGSIDRSQVPSYYRYGYGKVLGTTGRLFLHHDGPRTQFSLRMPGEGSGVFADRGGLRSKSWRVTSKPMRIRKQDVDTADDETDDFLVVRTSKKRKRGQDAPESSEEDEGPSYRSIEGKAKPHQYSDSDLESEPQVPGELVLTDQDNPLKWKSMQLSRRVKDHPEDIDAWLELANHQDDLLRAGEDIDRQTLEGEVHSYAEIKLSMLESALSNVSKSRDRERVLVPLMKEGMKVWSTKTAAEKWAEVRDDENKNFALWKTHLDFAMSSLATFQYDDVKELCLDRLHQLEGRFGPDASIDVYNEAIYIFIRTTRFIHDAGYKELAVAAWQAILELNLSRPVTLDNPRSALVAFQDFWESEVPRIGDLNAQGWNKFVEASSLGDPPEPIQDTGDPGSESRDDYKYWARIEKLRSEKARVPARTMDEGTEDDPFRVVMYTDIEPLLFTLPRNVLSELIPQLIDGFLIFFRFPPAFRSSSWMEMASKDSYLAGLSGDIESFNLSKPIEDLSEEVERKSPSFDLGGLDAAYSSDTLFSNLEWFAHLSPKTKDRKVELELTVNIMKHLVHTSGVESLAEYYMALSSLNSSTPVKKTAKALLKQYPKNLGLYNAYAVAEYAANNWEVASKVLASATELTTEPLNSDYFKLWRSWSWMELERGNKRLAIKRLCSSVDEALRKTPTDAVSPTDILKAQQAFLSNMGRCLTFGHLDSAGVHAECLALLSYLTADGGTEPASATQGNVSAAMDAFSSASAEFESRGFEASLAHERTLQFAARILYFNAARGPFRRAYMLEQLTKFITYFPRNTIFLSLFDWADSSLRVIDEVRTLLHDKVLTPAQDCFSSRAFAIQHEIQRGNINTAKAAFERAISSDACKASVPLWILYIRFCALHRELRPKGKDVFFRALKHCPWSKDVMMEAFLTLNRNMESSELKSVFNTMTAKGLRVHVDLEEFLERRRSEKKKERGRR